MAVTEKYFGSISPGPDIPKINYQPVKLDKNQYISYHDNITNPHFQIAFPTVPQYHPDEPALDVLTEIVNSNERFMLWDKLCCKHPKASFTDANHPCYEGEGKLSISVRLEEGEDVSDVEEKVREVLDDLGASEISSEDLENAKARFVQKRLGHLETLHDKAKKLGFYELMLGKPNMFQYDNERYANVTAQDIKRVYNKYIKGKPSVILTVLPLDRTKKNTQNNNEITSSKTQFSDEDSVSLVYKKPLDDFSRSVKPAPGSDPLVKVPEVWDEKFSNGLKISGIYSPESPYLVIKLAVEAGHSSEDLDVAGIAYLLSLMFKGDTEQNDSKYYSSELKKMGSTIQFSISADNIIIHLKTTKSNLNRSLKILEEKLLSIRLDNWTVDWWKTKMLDWIGMDKKNASLSADKIFMNVLYGGKNIYGTPINGTEASVITISSAEVRKYYEDNFCPDNTVVSVVGNIKKEEIIPSLDFLKKWEGKKAQKIFKDEIPACHKTRIYFSNKDKASQCVIRIGCPSLPHQPLGEQFKCTILNHSLGGNFSSRINQVLREDVGHTYGTFSKFNSSKHEGQFILETSVRNSSVDSSIAILMNELKQYFDHGIKEEEVEATRKSFALTEALFHESTEQKADYLLDLMSYNLPKDYLVQQQEILKNLRKPELDELTKKHLNCDNMQIVVVGDKSVLPKLKGLGYEVIEVNEK